MQIKIYSYGCSLLINEEQTIELSAKKNKITLAEVIENLGVTKDDALGSVLFIVNGKRVKMNYSLKDKDVIKIYPVIAGG